MAVITSWLYKFNRVVVRQGSTITNMNILITSLFTVKEKLYLHMC